MLYMRRPLFAFVKNGPLFSVIVIALITASNPFVWGGKSDCRGEFCDVGTVVSLVFILGSVLALPEYSLQNLL